MAGALGAAAALDVYVRNGVEALGGNPAKEQLEEAGRGLSGAARARAVAAKAAELVAANKNDDESAARLTERIEAINRGAQLARDVDELF
jgi:hypothetical protein